MLPIKKTHEPNEKSGTALAGRTLIQAGVVALVVIVFLLIWQAVTVFLVIFGGILLAISFHGASKWIHQKTHLPEKWSFAVVFLLLLVIIAAGVWFAAPNIADQIDQLSDRLPKAVDRIEQKAQEYKWTRNLMEQTDPLGKIMPKGSSAISTATGIFSSAISALGNLLIALVVGIFLAVSPNIYIDGSVKLVQPPRRARAKEILQETGAALESWLLAKIIAMLVIGVLTTAGLWFIGIELALVLGLIAGILSFIPNIGPILALVPAMLLALMSGMNAIIYVVLLYVGVQAFETYLLTPLLQQRMVHLPPALTISTQLLLGVLAGGLGLILATPLTAAAMVMVRMAYVEDILESESA